MGIHEAKTPKLVVSGAEKANIDIEKAKKAGEKRTHEVDSDDEAGPAKKVRVDEEGQCLLQDRLSVVCWNADWQPRWKWNQTKMVRHLLRQHK